MTSNGAQPTTGALGGLRVLELGSFIAAPFAGKLLADLGADVLKVELPEGEPARAFGPFPRDEPDPEASGLYLYLNANKRSVTLDYRTVTGRRLLLELARHRDALLCDLRPAEVEELRLGCPDLSSVNASLIVTSVTPFGSSGPYRDYLGCDFIAWHGSGVSDRYLGLPQREPLRAQWYLTDHWAGLHAAGATLAAYFERLESGQGQYIDIASSQGASMMVLGNEPVTVYFEKGETQKRGGYTLTFSAPCGLFPCKDGHVYLAALNLKQWVGLRMAMGDPEWADNPLMNVPTSQERMQYAEEIYHFLRPWLMQHTKEELFELCQRHAAPVTPAYNTADLAANHHLAARRFLAEAPHRRLGPLAVPGAPFKMSATPWSIRTGAPGPGEHNQEVLQGWLGLTRAELAGLRQAGVV